MIVLSNSEKLMLTMEKYVTLGINSIHVHVGIYMYIHVIIIIITCTCTWLLSIIIGSWTGKCKRQDTQ